MTRCVDSEHFLLPFEEIESQFPQGKHIMMEHFYRRMRKRFDILMQDGKPVGGKWNYDANNRNKLKVKDIEQLPQPLMFSTDVSGIVERLAKHDIKPSGISKETCCGQSIARKACLYSRISAKSVCRCSDVFKTP